eukprot:1215836-Karenia_brevis.AAC.1
MEKRIKLIDEIGVQVSETHAKSVLIGILDPETRKHTAMKHGKNTGYEELKVIVLEFANNMSVSDPTQLGRVGEENSATPEEASGAGVVG